MLHFLPGKCESADRSATEIFIGCECLFINANNGEEIMGNPKSMEFSEVWFSCLHNVSSVYCTGRTTNKR